MNEDVALIEEAMTENRVINSISLKAFNLGNDGVKSLGNIAAKAPSLETLHIDASHFDNNRQASSISSYDDIIKGVAQSSSIRDFKLFSSQKMREMEDAEAGRVSRLMGEMLLGDAPLEHLSVKNLGLKHNEGFELFAQSLAFNTKLASLDLSGNALNDAGVAAIARALETNTGIKVLNLSNCGFSDEGARALARMLSRNKTIKNVAIRDNKGMSEDGIRILHEAVRNSATVKGVDILCGTMDFYDRGISYLARSDVSPAAAALMHSMTTWDDGAHRAASEKKQREAFQPIKSAAVRNAARSVFGKEKADVRLGRKILELVSQPECDEQRVLRMIRGGKAALDVTEGEGLNILDYALHNGHMRVAEELAVRLPEDLIRQAGGRAVRAGYFDREAAIYEILKAQEGTDAYFAKRNRELDITSPQSIELKNIEQDTHALEATLARLRETGKELCALAARNEKLLAGPHGPGQLKQLAQENAAMKQTLAEAGKIAVQKLLPAKER